MNCLITLFLSISLFSVLSVTQTTENNSEVVYRYPTPVPRPSVYFDDPEVKLFIHYIVKKLLWVFDNLMLKDYETEIKQHNTSQMYKFRLPQETTTEEK
ncbi:unnamed protein product [Schistosoma mattheei]|uniref:Uncharacterized protein n=1 Tax=Schistosoma mattheei TaxID=31246 RepID=A0AA85ASR6_9TREM|nr:unnamed protein product [Schistosoma mattheei]